MTEKLKIFGEWFLPHKIENRIKGTLNFDGSYSGTKLKLYGNLDEDPFSADISDENVIHGVCNDGKEYTLVHCQCTSAQGASLQKDNRFPQCSRSYKIEYILKGHLINYTDLQFDEINFDLIYLQEWLAIFGFKETNNNYLNVRYEIKYELPSPINFKMNEQITGKIKFNASQNTPILESTAKIEQDAYFSIKSNTPLDLNDLLSYQAVIQNFFVFTALTHTTPTYIYLRSEKFKHIIRDELGPMKSISLYTYSRRAVKKRKYLWRNNFLFNYDRIANDFEVILQNWITLSEQLDPAFNLFLSEFYIEDKILESSYLIVAQVAETFHGKLGKHIPKPDPKCVKIKNQLLLLVENEEHRDWVERKSNCESVSFSTRLSSLYDDYCTPYIKFIIPDKGLFVKQVVDSRNYYTHFSSRLKSKSLHGADLIKLMFELRTLMISAFMHEIGFSGEKVDVHIKEAFFRRRLHI